RTPTACATCHWDHTTDAASVVRLSWAELRYPCTSRPLTTKPWTSEMSTLSLHDALPICPPCGCGTKWNRRVCVPKSASSLSVLSSCHVICRCVGCRMIPGAPNALHELPSAWSLAGSHRMAAWPPAVLYGTFPPSEGLGPRPY